MASVQENVKSSGLRNGTTLLEEMKLLGELQGQSGVRKSLNSELWHASAGPLVSLPQVGSLVYYFPQGHSEQVAVSTNKIANSHIPNYPNLPSQLMCQVHMVTLHADRDTDEIYAQMTLQPVNSEKEVFTIPGLELTQSKQPSEFFCKTLTASDTSTHGGFSVPRRAAEKLFPPLDYSMQPPTQELVVRDLHDNSWTFRHIYRGQPKRHLLTTGWSLFVGAKRLRAGDAVLFIRDEKSQLLLGVRRANRQLTALPSSVLSADSMHIGVLAAAAHAASNRSPFTVFYNPRACPSEFVIPSAKYQKAIFGTQVSIGMRFGMMFETEESGKRRYMGTVVGISDLDPLKWPNSRWRNIQVEWDEPGIGDRQNRVNIWEIETPENPFLYPSLIPCLKRPFHSGVLGTGVEIEWENMLRRTVSQVSENGNGDQQCSPIPNLGSELMKMILKPQLSSTNVFGRSQLDDAAVIQSLRSNEPSRGIPSTLPGCFMNGNLKQQEDTSIQTSIQRNIQLLNAQPVPALQNLLIQNLYTQNCLEQSQILGSNMVAHNHKRPHEQITDEPLIEIDQLVNRNEKPALQRTCIDNPEMAHTAEKDQLVEHSKNVLSPLLPQLHTEVHGSLLNAQNAANHLILNQASPLEFLMSPQLVQQQLEANTTQLQRTETSVLDTNNVNSLLMFSAQHLETGDWMFHPSGYLSPRSILKSPRSLPASSKLDTLHVPASVNTSDAENISSVVNVETCGPIERIQFPCISKAHVSQCLPSLYQELLDPQEVTYLRTPPTEHNSGIQSSRSHDILGEQDAMVLQSISNPCGLRGFSEESNSQSETYSSFHFESSNASTVLDPCVSNTCLEAFGTLKDGGFHNPPEGLVGNFCSSSQDVQSQITPASRANSQSFSFQELPDNSGGTSSSNLDVDENSLLYKGSWQQVSPPLRTYTKVQKLGSVGRSIDVTRFKDYNELKSAIACMFGLEGQLDDPRSSGWKLVYVDYENDVLLVGDDPWEEFVGCVRCIRILSPSEVQQMSQEGTELNKIMTQGNKNSLPEGGNDWDGT